MNFVKLTAAALALALGTTVAMAQTATTPTAPVAPKAPVAATAPAPSVTAPAAATAVAKKGVPKKAMTPEGQACSADADAKNLHGKERKKFRAACMKGKMAATKKN
jgi:psiF repeat